MKIVFKEWLKDKRALTLMLITLLMNGVYSVLNANIIIRIRNVLDMKEGILPIVIISVILIILGPLKDYTRKYAIAHNMSEMTKRWHNKIVDVDFRLFTKYSCSKINTIGDFIWSCSTVMKQCLSMFTCGISIVVTLFNMWLIGGKIVIPVLILYGLSTFLFKYLFSMYEKIDGKIHSFLKQRGQEIENVVNGFAEVRAFGEQSNHIKNMETIVGTIFESKIKRNKLGALTNFSFGVVDSIGMLIVLIYCMGQVKDQIISAATAMSLILYVFRIIDPLASILDFMDELSSSTASSKDFAEIMNWVNNIQNGEIEMEDFNNDIEIKNVSFSYNNSSSILNNINFSIKKGQKIGIVGASGNGKSTLAKLLLHFYEPSNGSISIDGIDLKDMTDKSFRSLVGTVQQENIIFPGTIMSNVTYGSRHSLESEVIDACKRARIYDFIMTLPEKFDTEVGPRGLKLSGGQQQRIALARLFLKNPEIIILDEATSALDNETESLIQDAINELHGKTIITIAHRLSTIKDSDRIYVLNNNTIAEDGNHDELLAMGGIYASMQK